MKTNHINPYQLCAAHGCEVGGQIQAFAAFSLRKEPPIHTGREAAWALEKIWTLFKRDEIFPSESNNTDSPAIQPIASSLY
jgi:hypothetical protein